MERAAHRVGALGDARRPVSGEAVAGRLRGRSVVVTRRGGADERLSTLLAAEGADVRRWPTLSFLPPEDPTALLERLEDAPAYDWIAFTSPRAAAAVTEAAAHLPRAPWHVAAIGESTARALRSRGWPVDLVSDGAGAQDLARALARVAAEPRVLFPAGSRARDTLAAALEEAGARVTRVEAYRTVVRAPPASELARDAVDPADAFTFASPSAVEGVDRGMEGRMAQRLGDRPAVAIGPTTAHALRARSVGHIIVAGDPSLEGVVRAVLDCCPPPPGTRSMPPGPS